MSDRPGRKELLFRLNEWLGVSTCLKDVILSRDITQAIEEIEELEAALRHIAEGTWWDGNEPWEFHRVESYALAALQENE